MMLYSDRDLWFNIVSDIGLLPDVTKPLSEPSSKVFYDVHLRTISQKMLKISIRVILKQYSNEF